MTFHSMGVKMTCIFFIKAILKKKISIVLISKFQTIFLRLNFEISFFAFLVMCHFDRYILLTRPRVHIFDDFLKSQKKNCFKNNKLKKKPNNFKMKYLFIYNIEMIWKKPTTRDLNCLQQNAIIKINF